MTAKYFVYGLPRSRTAWLSVFLSQSGIFCHHDGVNGCSTVEDYKEKVCGCGDSSTGFFAIDTAELYPSAPVVIIEKNKGELSRCIDWCDSTFSIDSREEMLRQYDDLMSISGLRVKQSEIDNCLPLIFEHLTGADWKDHYGIISSLNIQCNPHAIDTDAAKRLLSAAI